MSTTPIIDAMINLFPGLAAVRKALVEPIPSEDGPRPDCAILFDGMHRHPEAWRMESLARAAALKARGPLPGSVRDATVPASWFWGFVSEGTVTLKEETYVKPAGGIAPDAEGDWVNPLPAGTRITIGERARGRDPGFARVEYPEGFTVEQWTADDDRVMECGRRAAEIIKSIQVWVNVAANFTPQDWRQARLVAKGVTLRRIRREWVKTYPDSPGYNVYHPVPLNEQLAEIEAAEAKMAANT
jgi:hypothetical protein